MSHNPMTMLISAIASLLFIGLAILGRGGVTGFFSVRPLCAIAVATGGLVIVGLLSPGNLNPGEQEDRGNRWVLAAFAVIGFASAYLPAYTDRIAFWTVDGNAIRWLGVALFIAGGMLRLWPVFTLGTQFSGLVAIQPGHKLVTAGVFRIIRNPSYLGLLINAMGWALAFRSAVGVLLAILNVAPLVARIRSEERLLRAHFGREYDTYCARTYRLIPGLY